MSFGDLFKGKENEQLKNKISQLESMLTPEMQDSLLLQDRIIAQQKALNELEKHYLSIREHNEQLLLKTKKDLAELNNQISQAKIELVETKEEVLMQSFGLYTPRFAFANSTEYKGALVQIRIKQKEYIKSGKAATGNPGWTVNGDARKGAKMIQDMQKLLIRAFNCECDDVIEHIKFNNIDAAEKRILTSFSTISKLGNICGVVITKWYLDLKIQELHLAYEYQVEKQKEKDTLKQLRAEERERAKLEKEIAEARKKIEKEQKHYLNALQKVAQQITSASPEEVILLTEKKIELENQLSAVNESIEKLDYRIANQKAGYVYIISNIGAFGEGVYKIGMTRRLEPLDRIDELGDASVPFDFDVHALIFSENAPALEAALHKAFEDRKLNLINARREFFKVSLDEIKAVIMQNFDQTVDFVDVPLAEQFRQSELLRKHNVPT